jgi:hypothetical protein
MALMLSHRLTVLYWPATLTQVANQPLQSSIAAYPLTLPWYLT